MLSQAERLWDAVPENIYKAQHPHIANADLLVDIMLNKVADFCRATGEDFAARTEVETQEEEYQLDEERVMELKEYIEEVKRYSESQRVTVNICKEREGVVVTMVIPDGEDCKALTKLIGQSDDLLTESGEKATILVLWYGVYRTFQGQRVQFFDN